MVSFYAFPVIFIDTVLFKKGTLIKRTGVRTPWTPPGSTLVHYKQQSNHSLVSFLVVFLDNWRCIFC